MKKLLLIIFVLLICTVCIYLVHKQVPDDNSYSIEQLSPYQKSHIAHGGGALGEYTYSNCYYAIKTYYDEGIRLFELDVEYTTDNIPVMLHSWDGFQFKYLGLERNVVYSYEEFINAKMINDWGQLSLESTITYMKTEFPEMFLITDTKADNRALLLTISQQYSDVQDRIIPQVYNQEEYKYAKELGFKNIIYTLYMSEDTDEQIIEFCKNNQVFAITMPKDRALGTSLAKELNDLGIYVYAHTINSDEDFEQLKENGVSGIYTDNLF